MADPILFLSDTHFKYHSIGKEERKKRDTFLRFLESIHGAARLYLVGDIFDFWFEYRSVIPKYYKEILDGLAALRESGTRIFITGGNHDYWLGPFISKTLGLTILAPVTTHELQGRRVTITHGDMLLPGDYAYKTLKSFIRSRPVIAIARLVHPDILYWFAKNFSKASKEMTHGKTEDAAKVLIKLALDNCFKWDNDIFVMGHVHYPHIEYFRDKAFVILGDWEEHRSFVRLEDGTLSLEFYRPSVNTIIENR